MFNLASLELVELYLFYASMLMTFSIPMIFIFKVKQLKIKKVQIELLHLITVPFVLGVATKDFVGILKGVGRPLNESEQDSVLFHLYWFIAYVLLLIIAIGLMYFQNKALAVKNDRESDKQK